MEQYSSEYLAQEFSSQTDVLSPVLQQLFEIIGLLDTFKLVERFGGLRLYIPGKASADHPIAQTIGVEKMQLLCTEFAYHGLGMRFTLPQAKNLSIILRNRKIVSEYGPKTVRELAMKYRLGERQVERIVSSHNVRSACQQATRSEQPANTALTALPWR
ncbi:Mor transcription activator family protein [Diaphorobacter caeni]|uniref:Mor transcription activator family protein n=1 Tax=Diaphorobacter caeni TaxID=2784387 RepID=UPI00188FAA08|nr:Mor transcription activator family protein [Diaphorobacter caeni]MBF5004716.1 hypothetical protein [Diaphorobacter caeni]